ncbi:hypothetical protein GCM10027195_31030 [Comamonas sediminis]
MHVYSINQLGKVAAGGAIRAGNRFRIPSCRMMQNMGLLHPKFMYMRKRLDYNLLILFRNTQDLKTGNPKGFQGSNP